MVDKTFGTLYGVGVGPGDPELLTLKAVRVLEEADVIAAPDAGGATALALSIVAPYIQGKEQLLCAAPMVRDAAVRSAAWDDNAERICRLLGQGRSVAFVTLGDPSIYSTFGYLQRRVVERGFPVQAVPGVPSFCAAAAFLNSPLCEGEERLLVIPATTPALENCLEQDAAKVVLKAGRYLDELRTQLNRTGELEQAVLVENCGMAGERSVPLSEAETAGYFSTVIVKAT